MLNITIIAFLQIMLVVSNIIVFDNNDLEWFVSFLLFDLSFQICEIVMIFFLTLIALIRL